MSGQNNVDIDALLDLTEYDAPNYASNSPSLSPPESKPTFASPVTAPMSTPSMPSTSSQALGGPSHNYDMYRQQTGFVPGAIANTMAVNQSNNTGYQDFGSLEYLSNMSPENDIFDFNTSPSQGQLGGSDMDFESPSDTQNFFGTINPSAMDQDAMQQSPPMAGNVGRLWPGAHSQAALAKAQAQQRQQQQMMQQQAQRQASQQPKQKARGKAPQPADPIVEQKITQLLNSMRAKPASPDDQTDSGNGNLPRSKKEDEDMDEDERLLASEEGKKLSSKERRQLRNKVSARAFRSRRKEYITQLESEVAGKVNENGDLRAQNRALMEENKRLSDLTRMLLSSSSFSNFLDHLSSSPTNIPNIAVLKQEPQQLQQEQRQVPKDVSSFGNEPSNQQIGMAMIPEQNMDFSMLTLDGSYNYQPQVFVVDTLDIPAPIDTAILCGKTSDFIESPIESEEKSDVPVIERPAKLTKSAETIECGPVDDEFEADPEFALYHSEPAKTEVTKQETEFDGLSHINIFGGIDSEKVLSRFELVDASEEEATAAIAMARIQRISAHLESTVSRLEMLTQDL